MSGSHGEGDVRHGPGSDGVRQAHQAIVIVIAIAIAIAIVTVILIAIAIVIE